MKIMLFMYNYNFGGAEKVVSNLANYLASHNNDVAIMVFAEGTNCYRQYENVKEYNLQDNKNTFFRQIKLMKNIKQNITDYNPDIILTFLDPPALRALFLKKYTSILKNIPVIVSLRNAPEITFCSKKGKLLLSLYENADGFVFQTPKTQSYFNDIIKNKSIVIPNPLDPIYYDHKISNVREKRIVTVGRLHEQKNHRMLIDSFMEFEKSNPGYILEIYGEGELKKELENQIKSLNLINKVFLKGNITNVKKTIEKAKIFVLTSNYEGLSNALMEAMALGVPCISTKHLGGGAEMLIENMRNGILIDVNDNNGLIDAMQLLVNDDNLGLSISKNAVESMKKYNPETINQKWLEYIAETIHKFNLNNE